MEKVPKLQKKGTTKSTSLRQRKIPNLKLVKVFEQKRSLPNYFSLCNSFVNIPRITVFHSLSKAIYCGWLLILKLRY